MWDGSVSWFVGVVGCEVGWLLVGAAIDKQLTTQTTACAARHETCKATAQAQAHTRHMHTNTAVAISQSQLAQQPELPNNISSHDIRLNKTIHSSSKHITQHSQHIIISTTGNTTHNMELQLSPSSNTTECQHNKTNNGAPTQSEQLSMSQNKRKSPSKTATPQQTVSGACTMRTG